MFMGPLFLFLLPMLLFWALPIYFGIRWVRRAMEAKTPAADLPTREQLDRLLDRVESLSDDLESLKERQDFIERLLAPPRTPPTVESAPADPAQVPTRPAED